MLETCKQYLRITSNSFDDEITDLIEACKMELELVGIASTLIDDPDYLIKRAITLYVKAYFGYDNLDFDKLVNSYVMLRNHLSSSTDYTEV